MASQAHVALSPDNVLRRCRRDLKNEVDPLQRLNGIKARAIPIPPSSEDPESKWRNLPKPLKLYEESKEFTDRHTKCRRDLCTWGSKRYLANYLEETFCPKYRAAAWRGPTTFHIKAIHPKFHTKSVSLRRHISHFERTGTLRKVPIVHLTAFNNFHRKVNPIRQLPKDYTSRQHTKWERSLCNKSIARDLLYKSCEPNYQHVPEVFCPSPRFVSPTCMRQVLTGFPPKIVLTDHESGQSIELDLSIESTNIGLDVSKRITDRAIHPEVHVEGEQQASEESRTEEDNVQEQGGNADLEAFPPLDLDGTGDHQHLITPFHKTTQETSAGPWGGLESSFEGYNSLNNLAFGSRHQGISSETCFQLDRLKDNGQKLLRTSRSFALDGTSDPSDAEHPNLASFSFSFPAPADSASPAHPKVVAAEARAKERRQAAGQPQLASFPLPRAVDRNSPRLPRLSSPASKEFDVSVPTAQVPSSPEPQQPNFHLSDCTSEGQPSPTTPSPVRDENSKPRSLRRVIRADNSWRVGRKTPQTAVRVKKEQEPLLKPAPLELLEVKEVAFKRSTEFLNSVQPLQTPQRPTAKHLFAQEFSDEELKPEPLSVRRRTSCTSEDPETPRLTRELVLKYLASDESLSEGAESDSESTKLRVLRSIKKARREGVIFERLESESEDDSKLEKKLEGEITPMADLLHPESAAAMTQHRREAVRLAKSQETSVIEKCKRSNQEMPEYSFDELIGKGSYGRVYKGRQTMTKKVVAIKVIDIDEADFHSAFEQKDEQIKDFNREIRILKQAQDSGAPNMNLMIEALPVHSQLWLVCEYCPGGSVKTLMRATNDRLAEQYIIVVARELAKALTGLHEAGIMHRDIKAANVLIHEEGRLQLCDFGVATVLDTKSDKRKTFIGTPHWMPPELFVENPEYSDEVDVWEYGCTLYECALGKPPHSDLRERQQLASRMRRLKQSISLPEHEDFSDGLRNLVAYTLSPDAKSRPSMKDVLLHDYLLNTEEKYPTTSLSQLVKVYYAWLYSGGQRASLFMPGGAVVSDAPGSITTPIDEWNFSTTEVFEKRISAIMDVPDLPQISTLDDNAGDATPRGSKDADVVSPPLKEMTNVQKANFEARVQRGEGGLANLFDQAKPDYEYKTKTDFRPLVEQRRVSDLPFRAMAEDRPSSIASNVIDLGDFDSEDYAIAAPMKEETTIQLADAATIRAKRSDSKGPARDTSATWKESLTDDATLQESSRISAHDFAFPPKEWTSNDKSIAGSTEEYTTNGLPLGKIDGRKTMDWTFASAFPSCVDEDDEPQSLSSKQSKANKHATLEWSFSNAMAEADSGPSDDVISSTSTRTTPKRPTPLLRTMTQPVTSNEVYTAEDFPRPSTAMSEAYSETSMSSADIDPFALEGSQELPASMVQAMDDMGVGSYYNTNGLNDPDHTIPYTSTVAGPAPYMLGAPARIGEPGFPGPQTGILPSSLAQNGKGKKKQDSSGSSSSSGRPRVELPGAAPPSQDALGLDTPAEVVENELSRLLGGLQASLAGASQALQMMKKPKRNETRTPRGRTRPSSSEWEDEE